MGSPAGTPSSTVEAAERDPIGRPGRVTLDDLTRAGRGRPPHQRNCVSLKESGRPSGSRTTAWGTLVKRSTRREAVDAQTIRRDRFWNDGIGAHVVGVDDAGGADLLVAGGARQVPRSDFLGLAQDHRLQLAVGLRPEAPSGATARRAPRRSPTPPRHWPDLDEDLSIRGILAGDYGQRRRQAA